MGMKKSVVPMMFAGIIFLTYPALSLAYDNALRDPETHSDCNNTEKMVSMSGADVHPHHLQQLKEVLKRCDAAQKKIDAEKEKKEGESNGGMSGY